MKMIYELSIKKYADMVYRIALNYTNNVQDAEDVFQNTYEKLYKHDDEFYDDTYLKNWLVRVAINEAKDINKSVWKTKVSSIETQFVEPVYETEEYSELYEAIKKLKKEYRVLLYLFYFEGYSCSEIGDFFNIKDSVVRKRLERARKSLKRLLT